MVILFIAIVATNQVVQCFGMRFCELISPVMLVKLWEIGSVELMFELAGTLKIYRRVKDKFPQPQDKIDRKIQ